MPLPWFVHGRSSRKSSTLSMAAKHGELCLPNLALADQTRHDAVRCQDDPQAPRAQVTYVAPTRQHRGSPYESELGKLRFLTELSDATIRGIGSIPAIRLQTKR